jgi:hypothetical protein
MAIYFHLKHKDNKRRQCSYGCAKTYEVLKNPDKYEKIKNLFDSLNSPEDRYFHSVSLSRNMLPQTLETWTKDYPDSGDALLCYGARLLQWSWSARGYGRGAEISESQWQEFFSRLDKTRQVLLKCTEKSPEDPTPWAYLIMVATWYSDSEEVKYNYFNEAVTRDPINWAAHMHMIIALSEKWGGSNEEMIQFARNASNDAPIGTDLKAILVKAYIEYWKYLDMFVDMHEEANAFISDESIQSDIINAYNDSLVHNDFSESKISIFARYNLSGWFWITRDSSRLNNELSILGNKIEDIHWRWVGTEGELQAARAFVNES